MTSRVARWEQGLFVVEGPRLLAEALASSMTVHEVFVEDPAVWPDATLVRAGTLDRLGDVVTSQGVLAIVEAPLRRLEQDGRDAGDGAGPGRSSVGLLEIRDGAPPLVFVLVDVADPGNAGTILRTAEAVGASSVVFCGRGVDPLAPKVVRAAAGALFRVPFAAVEHPSAALDWCARHGLELLATVAEGGEDLYGAVLTGPVAVVLGSEARGLDVDVRTRDDVRPLTLPMAGAVESLNVAMAATAIGFEVLRQRRAATARAQHEPSGPDWTL